MEWRFDGTGTLLAPSANSATAGWRAVHGIEGLSVRDGLLVGHTGDGGKPTLSVTLPDILDADFLHAVEVRIRVSKGSLLWAWFEREPQPPDRTREDYDVDAMVLPLEAGPDMRSYRFTNNAFAFSLGGRFGVRHLQLEPTEAAGAEFAIESVRLVGRREHLRSIATGPGWHQLGQIHRETIVARSPQRVDFEVSLGASPWLDLALGTPDEGGMTFRVAADDGSGRNSVLQRTISQPGEWQEVRVALDDFAGQDITLSLELAADAHGRLGFWGSPVVRHGGFLPAPAEVSVARAALSDGGASQPRGVILIVADTLRRDHLDAYGYERATAPVLARMAEQGALFADAIAQAPWTKPSMPSILSSLYPGTHGVTQYRDLLPRAATTLAEVYRDAGFATWHTASHAWAGTPSGLEQGVEVLHEGPSLTRDPAHPSKTARVYVTRFLEWLERHDDVPFFAFLHFFDPHLPREPYAPYDTMWTSPVANAELAERARRLAAAGVRLPYLQSEDPDDPAVDLLRRAGVDPEAWAAHERAWYDGSIRAMDAEIGRLLEGLEQRGLARSTLVAFLSDHGEEMLEHGFVGHGQTAYGELLNVPLLLWWPGVVPPRALIEETVETIDLMPTLLDLSGLAAVATAQGQSLVPFLAHHAAPSHLGWKSRGAFSEKTRGMRAPDYAAHALVLDGWKLIHHEWSAPGRPEYELFDHRTDPLDQHDVAGEHPEVVERLAATLARRLEQVLTARIRPDVAPAESLSAEQVRRLRALGYLR